MADDKQVRLGISIDKTGAQQAVQTVDSVRKEFDTVKLSATQAGAAAQQAGRVTDLGWKPVSRTVQQVRDDVDETRQSLSHIGEGSSSFFRGISGLTGGALGEIAQTSRQIEEVTRGFQKMTSQGLGPMLQTLGPLTLAGGAVAAGVALINSAVDEYNKAMQTQREAIGQTIDIELKLADIRRKSTTEQAKQQLQDLQDQHNDYKAAYDKAKELRDQAAGVTAGKGFGELLIDRLKGVDVAGALQIQKAAQEEMDKWLKKITDTDLTINQLTRTLQDGSLAANDDAAQIKKDTDLRIKLGSMYGQSSDQIKKYLDGLQNEISQKQGAIPELQRLADQGNTIAKSTLDEFKNRISDIKTEIPLIIKQILPLVLAQEKQAQAAKDAAKATDEYTKALQKAEDDAFKKVQQRNTDLANAQERYETDVANIEAQSLQKRADIQQKYNDKLVEIAAKAAQDAEDRLAKLQQTRDDLAANFAQEEASVTQKAQLARMDVEIKAQRDERDALQEHLRALEDIRRAAQQREQGFLLDRNFLGLLQSRTQTGYDIEDENRKYLNAQQGRKQAIQDQAQDTARAFEQERQVRLQAYQKQLADAQQAYNREMAAAQKARQLELAQAITDKNKALQEEAQTTQQTLLARRKLHIQELQDIYDFGARKLKAERDFLQRAIDMIAGATGARQPAKGRPTQTVSQFAEGGAPPVGQWSMVNEPGGEQFNGIPFPGGLGMFYPLQPGYISNTNNSKRVNAPVTINVQGGQNPAETARMVKQEVVTLLERVMR